MLPIQYLSYQSKRKESLKYVLYLRRLRIANNKDFIYYRDQHLLRFKDSCRLKVILYLLKENLL